MAGFADVVGSFFGGGGGGTSQSIDSGSVAHLGDINFSNPKSQYVLYAGIAAVTLIALVLLKRK